MRWLGTILFLLILQLACGQDITLDVWVKRIQIADSTNVTCGSERVRLIQEERQMLFVSQVDTLSLHWTQSIYEPEAIYKVWYDQISGDEVLGTTYMEKSGHFIIIFVPVKPKKLKHSIIISTREDICKI